MEPAAHLEREDTEKRQQEQLYKALQGLDDRSQAILEARWLSDQKATLHELAERFGVSAERIRQIEKSALTKLRTQLAV